MTPKQLADFLQVSPSTIARQVKEGTIPHLKVGGKIRFVPLDVIQFLQKKK